MAKKKTEKAQAQDPHFADIRRMADDKLVATFDNWEIAQASKFDRSFYCETLESVFREHGVPFLAHGLDVESRASFLDIFGEDPDSIEGDPGLAGWGLTEDQAIEVLAVAEADQDFAQEGQAPPPSEVVPVGDPEAEAEPEPEGDPGGPQVYEKRTSKLLRYQYTPQELQHMGEDLAASYNKRARLESELATVKKDYAAKLERISGEISTLSRHINERSEMRSIDCVARYDFEASLKTFIRLDTGEQVDVERLTTEEKQMMLNLVERQKAREAELAQDPEASQVEEDKAKREAA